MKLRLIFLYLTFTTSLLSPSIVFAQSEKIPAEVIAQTANNDTTVPVLVGLNVPWQREDTLSRTLLYFSGRQLIRPRITYWTSFRALNTRSFDVMM
jgi:hypothetical protein